MDPKINTGGQAFPGFDEDGKAVLGQTLRADIAKHVLAGVLANNTLLTMIDEMAPANMPTKDVAADYAVHVADALIERLER